MQMSDATGPLKIIIGATATASASESAVAPTKIYIFYFLMVSTLIINQKRNTKNKATPAMQMPLSAEQNAYIHAHEKPREYIGLYFIARYLCFI